MHTNPNLVNITVSMCTFATFFNAHFHDPLWVVQYMEKKIYETLLNTQVFNIESFFMPCFPSCRVMTSYSLIHHLCDTILHFYDMSIAYATNRKHNCKREMGNYKTQSCLPRSINKCRSPKSSM